MNRYTASNYAERATGSTGAFNSNIGGFDESGITYDAGGNIMTLNRNSSTQGTNSNVQIDALTYTYSSSNPNQLQSVSDGTDANHTGAGFRNYTGSTANYGYDGTNGNITADPYKGLTIGYDVLNRTDKITFTTASGRYINYTYDAGGNLVRKQQFDGNVLQSTTDYIDGFVYITPGTGAAALSYFPMPEGRVLNNGGTFVQEFIITDQQGNARLSFQNNGSGTPVVKQENSYYAFGLQMPNSPVALPTTANKQLYNGGSEWQNDFSNLPDYYQTFNRNYDAALGRFVGVDPEAESAESLNTYNYAGNNPVMFNDPLGNKTIPAYLSQQIQDGINATLLGGGSANMDGTTWQDQGAFDDQGPFSTDNGAAGRAFWFGAEYSGGDLDPAKGNVVNIYHAGDGTSDDPHTGLSLSQLVDLNNGGTVTFGSGGVSYEYQTVGNTIAAQHGIAGGGTIVDHSGFIATDQGGLRDMTSQFDKQLQVTQNFFSSISHIYDSLDPASRNVAKMILFAQLVKTRAPFDLKNNDYSRAKIGLYSLYHGEKLQFGDYGQINYGVAARAFGIDLDDAIHAAGLNQIWQGKPDWSNTQGWFDGSEETPMIIRGYNMTIK